MKDVKTFATDPNFNKKSKEQDHYISNLSACLDERRNSSRESIIIIFLSFISLTLKLDLEQDLQQGMEKKIN